MVSVSPRLIDDLDTDEETDPRFVWGFHSLTLESSEFSHLEDDYHNDEQAFAGTPDPGTNRKRRQKRQNTFDNVPLFEYQTVADGDAFRLAVIQPGTGDTPIRCDLIWENSKKPKRAYSCLSYCWESINREETIFVDGYRFPVTKNLFSAIQHLRKPTTTLLIWIDQLCINQSFDPERGHQVSIMGLIFKQAHKVYVWLGEADHRTEQLCEYAKKMRRGDDSPRSSLSRLLSQRELNHAIKSVLERPWFQRVWVIPEVVLSKHTTVAIGRFHISWDNLVRLIRDAQPLPVTGFDKQVALLGNARQRVAIITQMISSQKDALAHTDITQLLILGKSSKATDVRDMVYAFHGWTYLTTCIDYQVSPDRLFVELVHMYMNSIQWVDSYSLLHDLTEEQRTFQLMSILYSAGSLHQHYPLPSWVPDLTFSWHLAPVWCKPVPNFVANGKDEWSLGIRGGYRAGLDKVGTFEILDGSPSQLRLSALVFDKILLVNEVTPASTPGASQELYRAPEDELDASDAATLRYGRHFFTTSKGLVGLATPGIDAGDEIAIILGGDVPVVLRPKPDPRRKSKVYQLLCECYVQSPAVMHGEFLLTNWTLAEDIVFI